MLLTDWISLLGFVIVLSLLTLLIRTLIKNSIWNSLEDAPKEMRNSAEWHSIYRITIKDFRIKGLVQIAFIESKLLVKPFWLWRLFGLKCKMMTIAKNQNIQTKGKVQINAQGKSYHIEIIPNDTLSKVLRSGTK